MARSKRSRTGRGQVNATPVRGAWVRAGLADTTHLIAMLQRVRLVPHCYVRWGAFLPAATRGMGRQEASGMRA